MICSLTLLFKDEQLILLIGDDHDESGIGDLIDHLRKHFSELVIEVDPFNQNQILAGANRYIVQGKNGSEFRKYRVDPRNSIKEYIRIMDEAKYLHNYKFTEKRFPNLSKIESADDFFELIFPLWDSHIYIKTGSEYEEDIHDLVFNLPCVNDSLYEILKVHISNLPEGNENTTNIKDYFNQIWKIIKSGKLRTFDPKTIFASEFITANFTVLMDWYALLNICLIVKNDLNSIIFVGDVHAQIYKEFLMTKLGFEIRYQSNRECGNVNVEELFEYL